MHNLLIPFYASWLYIVSAYYDYYWNRELYIKFNFINKIDTLFWNVFFFLPLSLYIILTIQPVDIFCYNYFLEIFHIFLNVIFGEIWFYSWHRLLHNKYFYKLHKKHHELYNPIGIMALYANPFDAIIVNMGSIYVLHYFIGFSVIQVYLVGTIATINTVVNSHSGRIYKFHQIHHTKMNCNFGLDLFMDKIFNSKF